MRTAEPIKYIVLEVTQEKLARLHARGPCAVSMRNTRSDYSEHAPYCQKIQILVIISVEFARAYARARSKAWVENCVVADGDPQVACA